MNNSIFEKIFIPITCAILGAIISQLFYITNLKQQIENEIKKEVLLRQTPALHRVKSILDYNKGRGICDLRIYNPNPHITDNFMKGKIDSTISVKHPEFFFYKNVVEKFYRDVDYLNNNKDVLSSDLFFLVERFNDFLENNPIPYSPEKIFFSSWYNDYVLEEWDGFMNEFEQIYMQNLTIYQ